MYPNGIIAGFVVAGLAVGPGLTVSLESSHRIDPYAIPAPADPHSPHPQNDFNTRSLGQQITVLTTSTAVTGR